MLTDVRWLALEVKYLDAAREFYADHLDLAPVADLPGLPARDDQIPLSVGGAGDGERATEGADPDRPGTALVLRRPTRLPRGGLHTHYALSIPKAEYDDWWDRLSEHFDLWEYEFGPISSLYFYDQDGNCVELAQNDVDGPGVDGIFEVVLEVADLDRSVAFYRGLGFEEMDREADRVRLRGPMDLELWEPRLGLADARGGVHVDLGFGAEDPRAAVDAVDERIRERESLAEGIRVVDPDGHSLTFV